MLRTFRTPTWAALASLLAILLCCPTASAKWEPGERLAKASVRAMGSAKGISDVTDFGFEKGLTILAAHLPEGKSCDFDKNLIKGVEYLILGGGDDAIEDLDLEIKDDDGKVVAEDTQTNASPIVRFTAKATGKHTIKATAYKANKGGYACLVIMRKDGWLVPIKNLADALTNLIRMCQIVDEKTSEEVRFHNVPNQWAMFGSVLEQGQETTISNVDMGTGNRIVMAACDNVSSDVDLYVKDKDDKEIDKDEKDNNTPICLFRAKNFGDAKITYKNVSSKKPSLVLTAVLEYTR